jgi:mannosylfructose-phosphate synthase
MSHGRDSEAAALALAERFQAFHLHMPRARIGGAEYEPASHKEGSLEVERRVLSACDMVLAASPGMARVLTRDWAVPTGKVQVCPPGFDDRRFFPVSPATREAIKERLGLSGRVVYSCGLPTRENGFASLVRAMPVVLARVEEARLALGVDRPSGLRSQRSEVAALRELAERLGVADRVVIARYPGPEELADHYRAADVFALCESCGAYDVHAVEAMACGTPTVVDGTSGIGEQIAWGVEALTADAGDAEAFGHAIAAVLQRDRLASQLGRCGAERARAEFTSTGVAQGVIGIVKSLPREGVAPVADSAQRLRSVPALAGV